jgi:hypothetical protein
MSKQALKRVRRSLKMEVNRKPLNGFAWPGGYPLYYVCADGGCLCPDCANAEIDLVAVANRDGDKQWHIIGVEANYEDESLCCDHCGKPIPAAYAD